MSIKSQENNIRRLTELLGTDLSYIYGERECGPNGAKKAFLHVGRTFLRALAKDLNLSDAVIKSNAAGIAVSGDCSLYGMWGAENGICIYLEQPCCGQDVFRYRTIRHMRDYKGGYTHYITLPELASMSYLQLLNRLGRLKKETEAYERRAA